MRKKRRDRPGLYKAVSNDSRYSLYKNPATRLAKIAPTHKSSIQPSGSTRGTGDHAACAKLPGKPAQNPTSIPILIAVFGPGPAVARLQAYRYARMIDMTKISAT